MLVLSKDNCYRLNVTFFRLLFNDSTVDLTDGIAGFVVFVIILTVAFYLKAIQKSYSHSCSKCLYAYLSILSTFFTHY